MSIVHRVVYSFTPDIKTYSWPEAVKIRDDSGMPFSTELEDISLDSAPHDAEYYIKLNQAIANHKREVKKQRVVSQLMKKEC